MKILALEPYYGGSHRSFIDGWICHSRHTWDLHTLPARKWKWRMRHSALTYCVEIEQQLAAGASWDVLFCLDMVNLAELRALVPAAVGALPAVLYFHENQLTYPVRHAKERDYQFGLTNITSALAAREVWFNSAFHRDAFLDAIPEFLAVMPDYRPHWVIERIRRRSRVMYPAIDEVAERQGEREPGPLRIVWAARWEFDKAPEVLFEAVDRLVAEGVDFRLSVLGQQFDEMPAVFKRARERLGDHIEHWGFLEERALYFRTLARADVFVSTAIHEFFGLAAVEAAAAGALPLVPERLAYPEVFELGRHPERQRLFYDGTAEELAARLAELAAGVEKTPGKALPAMAGLRERAAGFFWEVSAPVLDLALELGDANLDGSEFDGTNPEDRVPAMP